MRPITAIIDYNQVAISVLIQEIKRASSIGPDMSPDENFARHMIFNTIRYHVTANRHRGGETIIAADSPNSWRRQVFPNYKIGRRQQQLTNQNDEPIQPTEQDLEIAALYDIATQVRDALTAFFPIRVIRIPGAEADDIIAVAALRSSGQFHIISGDKDFKQLHKSDPFGRKVVTQYSPTLKKDIECDDPAVQLAEMILVGDESDSVPGIVCGDDWFATDKSIRGSKPVVSSKMKQEYLQSFSLNGNDIDSGINEFLRRYDTGEIWSSFKAKNPSVDSRVLQSRISRNRTLIELSFETIPSTITNKICEELDKYQDGDVIKASRYLQEMNMTRMLDNVTDFVA